MFLDSFNIFIIPIGGVTTHTSPNREYPKKFLKNNVVYTNQKPVKFDLALYKVRTFQTISYYYLWTFALLGNDCDTKYRQKSGPWPAHIIFICKERISCCSLRRGWTIMVLFWIPLILCKNLHHILLYRTTSQNFHYNSLCHNEWPL